MNSRRFFLIGTGVTTLSSLACLRSMRAQEETQTESDARRVRVQMETSGNLELDPTGKNPKTTPFRVRADFDFVEKSITVGPSTWSARDYRRADAKIHVGRGSTDKALGHTDEIVVHQLERLDEAQVKHQFTRASEALKADEVDLIHVQAITPVVADWFADVNDKSLGDAWRPESWTLAAVLALDSITGSDVKCQLRRRGTDTVDINVSGRLSGVANSVPTEVTLSGRCQLDAKTGLLKSLSWDVQEKRALGPATPGFDARTKIELTSESPVTWGPTQQTQFEVVRAAASTASSPKLSFESEHHAFRLNHGGQWKVIADNETAVILRMVDLGDLIAQTHVTRLDDLPAGSRLSKEKYRQDVAKAIKDADGQIVDVTESETARGYHALRVVVSAQVSGLPIQWIYYHITRETGQRVGWVITLEQDRIDRFGAEDQILLDDFVFVDAKAKPKAKTAESGKATTQKK